VTVLAKITQLFKSSQARQQGIFFKVKSKVKTRYEQWPLSRRRERVGEWGAVFYFPIIALTVKVMSAKCSHILRDLGAKSEGALRILKVKRKPCECRHSILNIESCVDLQAIDSLGMQRAQ
jgi:hypothetical protein